MRFELVRKENVLISLMGGGVWGLLKGKVGQQVEIKKKKKKCKNNWKEKLIIILSISYLKTGLRGRDNFYQFACGCVLTALLVYIKYNLSHLNMSYMKKV